jgi:hypothetical protein
MIIVQLLLLEICVRYFPWSTPLPTPVTGTTRFHPTTGSGAERITTRASRPHALGWFRETAEEWAITFWNWPTIWPYFIFVIIYTSVLSVLMYFFGNKSLFVECLGFVVRWREKSYRAFYLLLVHFIPEGSKGRIRGEGKSSDQCANP